MIGRATYPAPPGNKSWAWREAARRSVVLDGPYSIYQLKGCHDYIIRTAEAAAPNPQDWQRIATFTNGELSFTALPRLDP